jgi:Tol biopolymer transport system component
VSSDTRRQLGEWFCGERAEIRNLQFSSDGSQLAFAPWSQRDGASSAIGVWVVDAHTGEPLVEPVRKASQFDFSPDDRLLALKLLDEVRLLSASSFRRQGQLSSHEAMEMLAWSPDGRSLATASAKRTVKLWDVTRQREMRTLSGHTGGVRAVCFSPDGQTLATGGDRRDPTIRLWNVLTGQMMLVLARANDGVKRMRFSPDGRYFAFVTRNGQFQLLDVSPNDFVRQRDSSQ